MTDTEEDQKRKDEARNEREALKKKIEEFQERIRELEVLEKRHAPKTNEEDDHNQ